MLWHVKSTHSQPIYTHLLHASVNIDVSLASLTSWVNLWGHIANMYFPMETFSNDGSLTGEYWHLLNEVYNTFYDCIFQQLYKLWPHWHIWVQEGDWQFVMEANQTQPLKNSHQAAVNLKCYIAIVTRKYYLWCAIVNVNILELYR